jgi:hypothetical protein
VVGVLGFSAHGVYSSTLDACGFRVHLRGVETAAIVFVSGARPCGFALPCDDELPIPRAVDCLLPAPGDQVARAVRPTPMLTWSESALTLWSQLRRSPAGE